LLVVRVVDDALDLVLGESTGKFLHGLLFCASLGIYSEDIQNEWLLVIQEIQTIVVSLLDCFLNSSLYCLHVFVCDLLDQLLELRLGHFGHFDNRVAFAFAFIIHAYFLSVAFNQYHFWRLPLPLERVFEWGIPTVIVGQMEQELLYFIHLLEEVLILLKVHEKLVQNVANLLWDQIAFFGDFAKRLFLVVQVFIGLLQLLQGLEVVDFELVVFKRLDSFGIWVRVSNSTCFWVNQGRTPVLVKNVFLDLV